MIEPRWGRTARTDPGRDLPVSRLGYEVRQSTEPGVQELGVLATGMLFRWRVPSGLWTSGTEVHHLITELLPWSALLRPAARPWDGGRCVADDDVERSVARFMAGLQLGRLRLRLLGGRASGSYLLERLRSQPGRWAGRRLGDSSLHTH